MGGLISSVNLELYVNETKEDGIQMYPSSFVWVRAKNAIKKPAKPPINLSI